MSNNTISSRTLKWKQVGLFVGLTIALRMFNSGYQWLTLVVHAPNDPLYAFGPGIYGIAFAFLLSLVILRDPIWKFNELMDKESLKWLNAQSTQNT